MGLGRSRSWRVTSSVAIVVALGIAANIAILALLRQALFGSSPFPDPGGLVVVENQGQYDIGIQKMDLPELSWPDFEDLSRAQHTLNGLVGLTGIDRTTWDAGSRMRSVQRVMVTQGLFSLLGVRTRLGRTLSDRDFDVGAAPVVVITESLWRSQLGSDPNIVGRATHVDGTLVSIVGVIPDDAIAMLRERRALFDRGDSAETLVAPMIAGGAGRRDRLLWFRRQNRNLPMLTVVGRLKAGVSAGDADRDLNAISSHLSEQYPETNKSRRARALAFTEWRARHVKHIQPLLLAIGALAWLAACASAAGTVVADAIRRIPEVALRQALGASRRSVAWLVARRALQWTVPGGIAGLGLAVLIGVWMSPESAVTAAAHLLDARLISRAAVLTILAAVLLAVLAGSVLLRQNTLFAFREAAHASSPNRRRRTLFAVMVALQIGAATSMGLMCALLIRSMINLIGVDLGFDARNAFIVRVFLPEDFYTTTESQLKFFDTAMTRVRSLADVRSVSTSNTPPLSRVVVTSGGDYSLEVPGRTPHAMGPLITQYVSPGYFGSLGMRMVRGRGFTEDDYRAGSAVIVVDEAFCRVHLRDADPLATGIRMDGTLFRIAGVVHDVRPDGPTGDFRPTLYVLRDRRQPAQLLGHLVVRASKATRQLQDSVVAMIAGIDHRVTVDEPQPLEGLLADTLTQRRMILQILSLASLLVFLLMAASVGGVLTEFVVDRTRDLAVRRALGASPKDTAILLAMHITVPLFVGLILGCLAGWTLAHSISSQLFGVLPADLPAMIATLAAVLGISLVAAAAPLRRALCIEPAFALRAQ